MESSSPGDLTHAQANFDAGTAAVPEAIGEGSSPAAGSPTAQQQPSSIVPFGGVPASALEFTFNIPFNRIAKAKGDHWILSPEESEGLAECWKPVIDELIAKYLGGRELGPLYGALLATGAIFTVRANKDKQLSKAGKPASTKANTATARSTASPSSAESADPANQHSWPASPELSLELESSTP